MPIAKEIDIKHGIDSEDPKMVGKLLDGCGLLTRCLDEDEDNRFKYSTEIYENDRLKLLQGEVVKSLFHKNDVESFIRDYESGQAHEYRYGRYIGEKDVKELYINAKIIYLKVVHNIIDIAVEIDFQLGDIEMTWDIIDTSNPSPYHSFLQL